MLMLDSACVRCVRCSMRIMFSSKLLMELLDDWKYDPPFPLLPPRSPECECLPAACRLCAWSVCCWVVVLPVEGPRCWRVILSIKLGPERLFVCAC